MTDANESVQKRRQALEIEAKFSEPSNAKIDGPNKKRTKTEKGAEKHRSHQKFWAETRPRKRMTLWCVTPK